MDWRLKGTIQKVLGYVPGGGRIHYVLQRRAGGLTDFGRECDIKVDDWRLMMGHMRTANMPVAGSAFVEVGTGWYPTFPFCLYMAGAARVYTYDLTRLIKPDMIQQLADRLQIHVSLIASESGKSIDDVEATQAALVKSLANGMSLARATGNVVDYRAPADAAETTLLSESIDVVFSNSVLEHVPRPVIEGIYAEAMRVLRPGGLMFHSVNCGDHYAYTDRSIHQLHYLQFSDLEWERWNNEFLYQNRLRAKDFTEMATQAGFELELDTSHASNERLQQLDGLRIDPSFARYAREELAITSVDFIARKPR